MSSRDRPNTVRQFFRSLGPALIVACVVLGPGRILTSSKVGCQFGYQMTWVLLGAGVLMVATVATAARIGTTLSDSPCQALARRLGRPAALLVGVTVFLIASCFQFSNNLGVLAAIEPLVEIPFAVRAALLVVLNLLAVGCLYGLKRLYAPVEKLMMALVAIMLVGFAANLLLARPSLSGLLGGVVPRLPAELSGDFWPRLSASQKDAAGALVDPWIPVQGLIATTFSIAGAFYQAYLAKEKGWTREQLRNGLVDSFAGTIVLVGLTLMIMTTSAAVLAGSVAPQDLSSAGDVAMQLEPLFGSSAKWLFCTGVLAGALSSFIVNSMIGGTLLADGLGLDARMDSAWTKRFTVVVMLVGAAIALTTTSEARVPLIILAHALTVLGSPILAISLVYLASRRIANGTRVAPTWMIGSVSLGALVVLALAARTAVRIWLQLTGGAG